MTKVVARFRIESPPGEQQLARLADARGVYGILAFRLDEANQQLSVEYDATRLRPEEVAALLRQCGVAASPA